MYTNCSLNKLKYNQALSLLAASTQCHFSLLKNLWEPMQVPLLNKPPPIKSWKVIKKPTTVLSECKK